MSGFILRTTSTFFKSQLSNHQPVQQETMPVQFGIHIYMGPLYLRSEYLQTEAEAIQKATTNMYTKIAPEHHIMMGDLKWKSLQNRKQGELLFYEIINDR